MMWAFLVGAILSEVVGTLSLRQSDNFARKAWGVVVVVGYLSSFLLLSLSLDRGMALGVAYGIWAAAGVALTALAGRALFQDPLTPTMLLGIVAIMGGVLLIETGH